MRDEFILWKLMGQQQIEQKSQTGVYWLFILHPLFAKRVSMTQSFYISKKIMLPMVATVVKYDHFQISIPNLTTYWLEDNIEKI